MAYCKYPEQKQVGRNTLQDQSFFFFFPRSSIFKSVFISYIKAHNIFCHMTVKLFRKFQTGHKPVEYRGQSFKLIAGMDGSCCIHVFLCTHSTAFHRFSSRFLRHASQLLFKKLLKKIRKFNLTGITEQKWECGWGHKIL